jgi:protein-tyrosine-phosphatase/DNA-binding transcriptional ArsR family regulator
MRIEHRALRLAALADPARLAIVDALWRGDFSPSHLQGLLSMHSNLLAHHLKVLEGGGFVLRRRSEGDKRRSYLTLVRSSLDGLLPGTPGVLPGNSSARGHASRVVFVCTANTARSQLAAALWRSRNPFPVASAGTHPADRVHPAAVATARRHGLALRGSRPQHLGDVRRSGDVIVTVCDSAHEELDAQGALQAADTVHWSIPDPVRVGTAKAFDAAFEQLTRRIADLADSVTTPAGPVRKRSGSAGPC